MSATALVVGWEETERLVGVLAGGVARGASSVAYDRVVAVARGGMVPASLLAARLGIRCVEAVRVTHYEGKRRLDAPRIAGAVPDPAGPNGDAARTLVVDDVLETGGTLRRLADRFPAATFVVLVAKQDAPPAERAVPCGVPVPGGGSLRAIAASVEGMERWVVFPWSGADERP